MAKLSRRHFLTVGAASVVGIAGCAGNAGEADAGEGVRIYESPYTLPGCDVVVEGDVYSETDQTPIRVRVFDTEGVVLIDHTEDVDTVPGERTNFEIKTPEPPSGCAGKNDIARVRVEKVNEGE